MEHLVVKVAVIESERGWGRKIDDYMVCLNVLDAFLFEKEFNSKNTAESTPDWYMQVEGDPTPIDISEKQYNHIQSQENKREWLSKLKKL